MRTKILSLITTILLCLAFVSICHAQNLNTSTDKAYADSLSSIFNELSTDQRLELEAFIFCLMDGGKPLVSINKLRGFDELKAIYPIIEALELEGSIKLNGLSANEIVSQGRKLLSDNLQKKIDAATDETLKENLKAQLAIVKKPLTAESLKKYEDLYDQEVIK